MWTKIDVILSLRTPCKHSKLITRSSMKLKGHDQNLWEVLQQSLMRTAKGALVDKTRALGPIPARSEFIRCTIPLATLYLLPGCLLPAEVSSCPRSTTNLDFFSLLCLQCALIRNLFIVYESRWKSKLYHRNFALCLGSVFSTHTHKEALVIWRILMVWQRIIYQIVAKKQLYKSIN